MSVNIDMTEPGPVCGAHRFVLLALRGVVGIDDYAGSAPAAFPELSEAEVPRAAEIVARSKIAGLVLSGAKRLNMPMAPVFEKFLEAQRQGAIVRNMQNLIETAQVSKILSDAGINHVVMKGPVRSHEVFAALDTRPSVDIDILVSRADYGRTGELLCANGYTRGVSVTDRWWNEHLGESPYRPIKSGCTVDVHHKVQQPGGPGPRDIDEFINDQQNITLIGRTYRILSKHHALLLAYISVSKAMRNGEAWIGQATEILVARKHASQGDQSQFNALIERHGLSQMIGQIDVVIACLYDAWPQLAKRNERADRRQCLAAGAFGSAGQTHGFLHRSRLLWEWTAGEGFGSAARFFWLTGERMISDWRRPRADQERG